MSKMKILEITFKGWLRLWRTLLETVVSIVLGLLVVVFRGFVKGTMRCYRELVKVTAEHPKGALAGFVMCLVLVWLMSAARGGIERQEASLVVDSISHICDSLRNGDRYDAGYADGIKSMRKRNVEKGV